MLSQPSKERNPGANADPVPLGTKIIRNVLFGGLRYVLVAPIPFIMTPLILHKIGVEGYGTWAVFLAINGLTSLADLGLVGTLSKFVAEGYARRDYHGLTRLLNSGLTLFLLLDCVIVAVLWGAAPLLASKLFHGTTATRGELVFLLRCFVAVIAANIFTQLFASITSGLQRLDLTNVVSAANTFLSALLGGLLLLRGWGLPGLVYGYIASGFVTVIIYFIVVRRLLPEVAFNLKQFHGAEAKRMFGYSLRLYITQAAVLVHNQVEKIFLATLVGVAPVGWYEIASDIALKIRGSLGIILSPVLPAASELNALADESRMKELYYRTHKYLALFGVPVVCYVISISSRFVELWLGPSMTVIALPLSVLLAVNYLNLATGPGFLIFAGSGYMKPGIQSAILGLVLNVTLSLVLIYKFGFAGAVVGTSTALIVAAVYFVAAFHRRTGYSMARLLRESYLKPVLCSIALLGALLAIRSTKEMRWFGLAAMGIVFGIFYGIAILLSRFFDEYDWTKIERFLPAVGRARKVLRIA